MCVCGKPWIKGYKQGVNSPSSYVAPWSYGRCGGRVHGRMNLYPLSVWDPATWRSGLPFIISCHAFSKVGEQGQVAEVHRHLVFHRNGQHDNITSHNMTCFHVISFHPLPSGCIQVCLSCTRISDKVPGKLGVRPPGKPDYFQVLPDIMLPEANFAQASRRCLSEFSSRRRVFSEFTKKCMFRIRQNYRFFISEFPVSTHNSF